MLVASRLVVIGVALALSAQSLDLPLRLTGASIILTQSARQTMRFEMAIGRWPTDEETLAFELLLARGDQEDVAFYQALEQMPEVGRVLLGQGPSAPVLWAEARRASDGWRLYAVTYQIETMERFAERQRGRSSYALVLIELELDRDRRGRGTAYQRAKLVFDRGVGRPVIDGEHRWEAPLLAVRPLDGARR